ncbi:cation:proton antiporter, partial [Salmonella enterica subsp. enterica]|nr:cation:proton antiporter [Salmonella enterica subsp. enterica]
MNILLTFAVIILATKLFDSIAIRMELPTVVGSLIAGILIGPSGFNIIQTNSGIEIFAHIGVILLMFLAGLECDLQILRKYFKPSLIVGTLGVFVPFILFGLVSMLFSFSGPEALA